MKTLSRLFTILLFSFCCTIANGSDSTKNWKDISHSFKTMQVNTRFISLRTKNKLLKNLEIMDLRYNKNHLGMYSNGQNITYQLSFSKEDNLEKLFVQKLADLSQNLPEVLVVIQHLWMTEVLPHYQKDAQHTRPAYYNAKLYCKLDFFIKQQDAFQPLVRIDTTFWHKNPLGSSSPQLLKEMLESISGKVENAISAKGYETAKTLTKNHLSAYYNINVQQEFPAAKKGIYYTYDDFKNNTPTAVDFTFSYTINEPPTLLMKDEKGADYLTRKVWGLCDGKDFYIMQEGYLFKLFKDEQAFYWMGLKYIHTKSVGMPVGIPLGGGWAAVGLESIGTITRFRLSPYLLNLEKGVAL